MSRRRRMKIPNPELLHECLQVESEPTVRLRLMVLRLVAELPRALTLTQICAMIDIPEPTVYLWARAWRERGYAGLCHPTETGGHPGRPPTLDASDLVVLKGLLQERPFWQTREVRRLLREHFGVELSVSQVSRILREKLSASGVRSSLLPPLQGGEVYPSASRRATSAA